MAKAREPKVFRSMDDLPLMLTPYLAFVADFFVILGITV